MKRDKEELREDLEHQRKLVRVLRQRRRDCELKAAQYGIDIPSHISIEIENISKDLREHEKEIERLETEISSTEEQFYAAENKKK